MHWWGAERHLVPERREQRQAVLVVWPQVQLGQSREGPAGPSSLLRGASDQQLQQGSAERAGHACAGGSLHRRARCVSARLPVLAHLSSDHRYLTGGSMQRALLSWLGIPALGLSTHWGMGDTGIGSADPVAAAADPACCGQMTCLSHGHACC